MHFVNFRLSGRHRWVWLTAGLGVACATLAQMPSDTPAAAIEGDWLVQSRDAIIRIELRDDSYVGTIVWQLHDTYGPEDGPELNGKVVTDRHNPDPALRTRPLTGLRLLWGLRYDAAQQAWVDGHVYNSDNGKDYHCEIHLASPDRLVLHGYIGIPLLGGNTTWTRTHEPFPAPGSSIGAAH